MADKKEKWTKDEAFVALVKATVPEEQRAPYFEAFDLTPEGRPKSRKQTTDGNGTKKTTVRKTTAARRAGR